MAAKLNESRLVQADFRRNLWLAQPEPGTALRELLDPHYWAHNARKMKRGDRIEILAEDNAYFAELIVLQAGNVFAKVEVLRFQTLGQVAIPDGVASIENPGKVLVGGRGKIVGKSGAVAEWGGAHKFRVRKDDEILQRDLGSMDEAIAWMEKWEADVARPALPVTAA